jgi:predicted nucleic acid-binding protein
MPAEFFLDTNVLVYTFDRSDLAKRDRSRALVERALETGDGVVSYQVVQEFLNVALHRFDRVFAPEEAVRYLRDVLDPICTVFSSLGLYEHAISLQRRWRFSFYDSLIIAGALEAGCKTLYSEDLQDGQQVESLRITNPF